MASTPRPRPLARAGIARCSVAMQPPVAGPPESSSEAGPPGVSEADETVANRNCRGNGRAGLARPGSSEVRVIEEERWSW